MVWNFKKLWIVLQTLCLPYPPRIFRSHLSLMLLGIHILFTGLFTPCVTFALLHLQADPPRLGFAQAKLCLREIIWNTGICPALNLSTDEEGKRGQHKTSVNIPLSIQYFRHLNLLQCNHNWWHSCSITSLKNNL